uniref:RING-type domain-containing protein n=1 Tax=Trichobilharzia regenti TaxID=157069 RepID=A0AA85KDW6_TRIRE|nr:unnamed protein product [Trichobilharzia regenti]
MFGSHTPKSLGYCMKLALSESLHDLDQNIRCAGRLSKINYEDLVDMVLELNKLCTTTFGERCSSTRFSLKKHQRGVFWRLTTKVFCSISRRDGSIYRVFDLKEFMLLYDEIIRFKSIIDSQPKITTCSSDTSDDPCCICLDREPDTVLPCMHVFCQICINKWAGLSYRLPSANDQSSGTNSRIITNLSVPGQESNNCRPKEANRTQCPICRSAYTNTSTSWQIIGTLSPKDHTRQISGIVLRMISRAGQATDAFSEVDDDDGDGDSVEVSVVSTSPQNNVTENL